MRADIVVCVSSLALYRRYRPETFAQVIGQEHVTDPLQQALRNNRVNHAYLFSGPRGCGKTTSARILARCLNCEKGPTPDPCGECQSCVDLARNGRGSIDVIEIDAASHGGVDDARELREKAFFGPAGSRYKIYIIDEAHMVTSAGFNALLKVVEEPPEHLKFIFATTEPEKVIGTIRSRTHHYPFRLVPPGTLRDYLAEVCGQEDIPVEEGVLPLVVRAGAGSVRDSMSVMDQLLAGAGDAGVTYAMATSLLGYTDGSLLDSIVEAFAAGDGAAAFEVVDRVIEGGNDPRRFVADLLERLRDLVILAAVPDAADKGLIDSPADVVERMQAQASVFGGAELARAADLVNSGLTEMRGATSPRLQLELICARVLLPAAYDDERSVQARLDRLERGASTAGLSIGGAVTTGVGGPEVEYAPGPGGHAGMPAAGAVGSAAGAPAGPAGPAAARAAVRGTNGGGAPGAGAGNGAGVGVGPGAGVGAGPGAGVGAGPGAGAGVSGVSSGGGPVESAGAEAAAAAPGAWPGAGGPNAGAGAGPGVGAGGGTGGEQSAQPGAWPGQGGGQGAGQRQPGAWPGQQAAGGAAGQRQPGGWPTATAPGQGGGPGGAGGAGGSVGGPGGGVQAGAGVSGQPGQSVPVQHGQQAQQAAQGGGSMAQGAAQVRQLWPEILEAVKGRRRFTWILLSQNAQVAGFDGTTLQIGFPNAGARDSFANGGSEDVLRQALADKFNVQWKVEAIVDPSGGTHPPGGPGGGAPQGGGFGGGNFGGGGGFGGPSGASAPTQGGGPGGPSGGAQGGSGSGSGYDAGGGQGAQMARQAVAPTGAASGGGGYGNGGGDGGSGGSSGSYGAGTGAGATGPAGGGAAESAYREPEPAPVSIEDDMPAEDDPDLVDSALSGHDLIVRELGATVVEEFNNEY